MQVCIDFSKKILINSHLTNFTKLNYILKNFPGAVGSAYSGQKLMNDTHHSLCGVIGFKMSLKGSYEFFELLLPAHPFKRRQRAQDSTSVKFWITSSARCMLPFCFEQQRWSVLFSNYWCYSQSIIQQFTFL